MSYNEADLAMRTVPELREIAKKQPANIPAGGFSKMRKAELIDFVIKSQPAPVQTIHVPTVGTFEANSFLAFVGSALAGGLSEQDQRDLDMAKYRGRYEGKSVRVGTVHGRVTGGTHRDTDPTGRSGGTLLLTIRHNRTRYGHPRVTLHRAEDVVLV